MRRERSTLILLLVAAAALLGLASLLSRCGQQRIAAQEGAVDAGLKRAPVVFPRDQVRRQRTQGPIPAAVRKSDGAVAAPADSVERAVRGPGGDGAVFVEVNAIRHSPLVDKMLRCREGDAIASLDELKEKLGIDLSEDVDRIGLDGDTLVVSGFFKDLKVPPELGDGTGYGDAGRIWALPGDEGKPIYVGRVGDGMLVTHFDEAGVKAAIDRAEGRGATGAAIPVELKQSELYGVFGKQMLGELLGDSTDPMAQRMLEMVDNGNVRMSVDDAVAMSLDMKARSVDEGKDLARAVGGALSVARQRAVDEGQPEVADLLEQARVEPRDDGSFGVDVAVPGDVILKAMGCDADGHKLVADGGPGK